LKFVSGVSLATTFDGEFSDVTRSYAGRRVARHACWRRTSGVWHLTDVDGVGERPLCARSGHSITAHYATKKPVVRFRSSIRGPKAADFRPFEPLPFQVLTTTKRGPAKPDQDALLPSVETFDKRPQVNQAAIVENKRLGPILAYNRRAAKEARHVPFGQGARGDVARRIICSRSDRLGHPGVALRDLEASRDALSRGRYQPQPTERRLSCSHRVTFLTGANRDFPNWRRQSCSAARGSVLPTTGKD